MKRNTLFVSILLAGLLAVGGCTPTANVPTVPVPPLTTANTTDQTTPAPSATTATTAAITDIEATLERIYERVNPSVVNINIVEKQTNNLPQIPGLSIPQQAEGSGFVWDTDGNIVTNNHVIENADKIRVTFYDGTIVTATLVGIDADSDLAVVKVDVPQDKLKPVELADSSVAKVGQMAIAIGNPFGLQSTMTVGFVSGLGRLIPADQSAVGVFYNIPDIIQTDAPINPGNSGGVLLDDTGKLLGVTQSIATESGSSAGIGFAIPSAIVQQVVPALISTGRYEHPYLGVSVTSMNPDIAAAMNLPESQRGALVATVVADGPAARAGLSAGSQETSVDGQTVSLGGDVIIKYDDLVVKSSDDVVTFLARYGGVGQNVTLTVLRDGQVTAVTVTLGVRPSS